MKRKNQERKEKERSKKEIQRDGWTDRQTDFDG